MHPGSLNVKPEIKISHVKTVWAVREGKAL